MCGVVQRFWTSTRPDIAAVSGTGIVTGVSPGSASIVVTDRDSEYGATDRATLDVTVTAPVRVEIAAAASELNLGAVQQLSATGSGAAGGVTWSTSAPTVVSVSATGLTTAVGNGVALITATSVSTPTRSASVSITVSVRVDLSPASVLLTTGGATRQLTAFVTGSNDTRVTWSSSNPAVASVTNGIVTPVAAGAATIRATSVAAPAISGTVPVTVEPSPAPLLTLTNRWTFSESGGSGTPLIDDIGGRHATIVEVGSNNATVQGGEVLLTGGDRANADYVALPSGLLSDRTSATIEVWATPLSHTVWGRIFDIGASTSNYLIMSWSQGSNGNTDRAEWIQQAVLGRYDNAMAPYALGEEVHIVMTIAGGAGVNGSTRVHLYKNGQSRGFFDVTNQLVNLSDTNAFLGRSAFASDQTANAAYNEVRIYSGAMTAADVLARYESGPVPDK